MPRTVIVQETAVFRLHSPRATKRRVLPLAAEMLNGDTRWRHR
jgi:hypothetical protein